MHMNMFSAVCVASLLTLGLLSNPLAADVIESDNLFGIGAGTIDEQQQLEFLDLNLTLGFSYTSMVEVGLAEGGNFAGWRHATNSEIMTLVHNAGITPPEIYGSMSYPTGTLDALMGLLGITLIEQVNGDPVSVSTRGFSADDGTINPDFFGRVVSLNDRLSMSDQQINGAESLARSFNDIGTGHWLVRDVPSPATLLALTLAASLAPTRRR